MKRTRKSKNYYGCAFDLPKDDERLSKFAKQRKRRGFDDTETWGLGLVVIKFTLPRLKRFREVHNGYPMNMTAEKWLKILDEIIFAFEWAIKEDEMDDDYINMSGPEILKNCAKARKGFTLFGKYLMHLWW